MAPCSTGRETSPSPHHRDPKPNSFCRLNCQSPAPKGLFGASRAPAACFSPPRHYLSALQHGAVGSGRAKGQASRGALGDQGVLEMPMSEP